MIPKRAMNNSERQTAAELKKLGFLTIWQQEGPLHGAYYASHSKLTMIYDINTKSAEAVEHLKEVTDSNQNNNIKENHENN
ncbi:MAG: hypothetical protein [Bacteriophage sp.]|nr:MAG: hypothetical protein [Bacteriophage sp.]